MKKLNVLFIALFLVFSACSKDDGPAIPEVPNDIVGIWKMVDYQYSGTTVTVAQGQTLSTDFVGEALNINNTITFSENPSILIQEGGFDLKLTSTTLGQTSAQTFPNQQGVSSGTWDITNEGLFIEPTTGLSATFKIEELNKTSLVLSINRVEDLSQGGASIISTINAVVTYERVSKDDIPDTNNDSKNKLVLNGKEYVISKAFSYSEANAAPAGFYYYDLTFLSEGLDYKFITNDDPTISGKGGLLDFTLNSETKLIKEGEYTYDKNQNSSYHVGNPIGFTDFTFNDVSHYNDFEGQTGYFEADEFDTASFNVTRDGDVYTIKGSGTFDNIAFSLEYTGKIVPDPESEL